jgi:hypothetical protein
VVRVSFGFDILCVCVCACVCVCVCVCVCEILVSVSGFAWYCTEVVSCKKRMQFFFGWLFTKIGARCWWRSWLRYCATSRKVAGSIPDGVIGIFY